MLRGRFGVSQSEPATSPRLFKFITLRQICDFPAIR